MTFGVLVTKNKQWAFLFFSNRVARLESVEMYKELFIVMTLIQESATFYPHAVLTIYRQHNKCHPATIHQTTAWNRHSTFLPHNLYDCTERTLDCSDNNDP